MNFDRQLEDPIARGLGNEDEYAEWCRDHDMDPDDDHWDEFNDHLAVARAEGDDLDL